MDKAKKITEMTKGMDRRSTRYKRTKEYLEGRARPGEEKTLRYKQVDFKKTTASGEVVRVRKNWGLSDQETFIAGCCPCSVCGHEFHWECEDNDCQCCSSACT